jgi:hypothetical protein
MLQKAVFEHNCLGHRAEMIWTLTFVEADVVIKATSARATHNRVNRRARHGIAERERSVLQYPNFNTIEHLKNYPDSIPEVVAA